MLCYNESCWGHLKQLTSAIGTLPVSQFVSMNLFYLVNGASIPANYLSAGTKLGTTEMNNIEYSFILSVRHK